MSPHFQSGELGRLGEIRTPWPSWHIVASSALLDEKKSLDQGREESGEGGAEGEGGGGGEARSSRLEQFLERLNKGVEWFEGHKGEAVEFCVRELGYARGDAEGWGREVEFVGDVRGVKGGVVEGILGVLRRVGVLGGYGGVGGEMIAIEKMEEGGGEAVS